MSKNPVLPGAKRGTPLSTWPQASAAVSLVAQTELLEPHRQQLLSDVEAAVHPDSLQICDGLSMIAVVGRGMAGQPHLASQLFAAVGKPASTSGSSTRAPKS